MTPIPRDTPRPTATRRKPPIRRPRPVPEATLLHTLADVLAAIAGRAGAGWVPSIACGRAGSSMLGKTAPWSSPL